MVENDIDEFHPGTFLAISKIKLRKVNKPKIGSKRHGRGSKTGASPTKWTRKRRKLLRNSAESYENVKGDMVEGKVLKDRPCKPCKFTNCANVSEEERKQIFTHFYKSGMTFDEQNVVLVQNIQIKEKKVTKVVKQGVTSRAKSVTQKYLINKKVVCKELFLATYAVTNGRLQRVLEKVKKHPNAAPKDERGKHNRSNVIDKGVYNILVSMIE